LAARLATLLLPVLLGSLPLPARAEEPGKGEGKTRVKIEGNDRTAEGVILKAARLLEGDLEKVNPADIERCVINRRLFSDVDVVSCPDDDPALLYIRVRERWTLTPVPFVSSFEGESKFGLDVVDYNFLGRGMELKVGGVVATRGYNVYMSFRDPAILYSSFSASASTAYRKYTYREYDRDDVVASYNDELWFFDIGAGYELDEGLEAGLRFTLRHDRIVWKKTDLPLHDGWGNELGAWASFDRTDYHYFFSSGPKVRFEASVVPKLLGAEVDFLKFFGEASHTLRLPEHQCLTIYAHGGTCSRNDARFVFQIGGTDGTRGIRAQGVWAHMYGALGLQYQVPFWQVIHSAKVLGTFALTAWTEYGSALRLGGERLQFAAAGVGIRFYLRDVTIPTIAIDLLYDPFERRLAPGIGVGTNW
jgi:outer membrane protein assembly factor BamA